MIGWKLLKERNEHEEKFVKYVKSKNINKNKLLFSFSYTQNWYCNHCTIAIVFYHHFYVYVVENISFLFYFFYFLSIYILFYFIPCKLVLCVIVHYWTIEHNLFYNMCETIIKFMVFLTFSHAITYFVNK